MTLMRPATERPGTVTASVLLMVMGLLSAAVWGLGATQGWWVSDAGLTQAADLEGDFGRALEASRVDMDRGSIEDARRVLNGTTVILALGAATLWAGTAAMVWRGIGPARAVATTSCLVGVLCLLGWAMGSGVANTLALQVQAGVMLLLGLAATALLYVPASSRWFDSASTYRWS